MKKKILFVTAPYHTGGIQVAGNWPPLYMVYVAGAAREAGAEARIYDAMTKYHTYPEIAEEIRRFKPDYVMTMDYQPVTGTISTGPVPAALGVLRVAKEVDPSIVTIISGTHPTFMYEEMFNTEPALDFVILGEGELALKNFLSADSITEAKKVRGIAFRDEGRTVVTKREEHIKDLDTLRPAWDLLDWSEYVYHVEPGGRLASVLTSRGCDMGCSFCSQRVFWKEEWRGRDPEKVVEEISFLHDKYDIKFFTVIDAYPTKDRKRWERILDLLIEKRLGVYFLLETRVDDIVRDRDILHKYREAGFVHIYIGAESADKEVLDTLNKGINVEQVKEGLDLLREHGIISESSFMIGFLHETWETVNKTLELAIYLNPDVAVFPIVTPWPYTPLYQQMKERIRVFDYSKYDLLHPIAEPYKMTLREVDEAVGRCYQGFYSRKIPEIVALKDEFKKNYMLSAFKLMMKDFASTFKDKNIEMRHPI